MSLLSNYLEKVRIIRAVQSTDELSFYAALEKLFNAVGEEQTPPVRCVMNLKDIGAGLPDGGLFTSDQIPESSALLFEGEIETPPPSRGAIEAKSPNESLNELQESGQVARYLGKYGTVLITNLRAFRLLAEGNGEGPDVLERFTLAETPDGFWELASNAGSVSSEREERFAEFLRRTLTHGAPLAHPEDVARLLASYAQDAKLRLGDSTLEEMDQLREAIETALGVTFQGERGERFFRSTIIQTLFYGVFSAWVLWHRDDPTRSDKFDWKRTAHLLRVPVLQTLFHQLTAPGNLEELRLKELLDWTGDAMNRIDRLAFFERFSEEEAVQYFYEPFLEAFDPELREELGVWYTPSEIVEYQVRRIDTVLEEELGISAGLADERVKILDPCCGTGAYLVETLNVLAERFREQGEGDLVPAMVKEAATSRIYGFEILTAPFVVSHLQLGLTLAQFGAPLKEDERAGVYLTNALTGWEPPEEPQTVMFPKLEKEREQADTIKQEEDILVILGNPPYDGYAGVAPEESEERELSNAYRGSPEGVPEPEGQGLNNPYVRFFRMAERQITEYTDRGIVCYITNYSWLDGRSHSGMRARYLNDFDRIWIDNLHGDRIISERNPEGRSSQTVFAMRGKSPGIRNGTAVSLLCRNEESQDECLVRYRDFHQADAAERRSALMESLGETDRNAQYAVLNPNPELALPLKPRKTSADYFSWPELPDVFPKYFPGVQTKRDDFVIDVDKERLVERLEKYFDPEVSDEEMREVCPRAMKETSGFDAKETRDYLKERGFKPEYIVRHVYRPMDLRWLYWEPETDLLERKSPDYFPHVFEGNLTLTSSQRSRKEYGPPCVGESLLSLHMIEYSASCFPMYLDPQTGGDDLFSQPSADGDDGEPIPNLSDDASTYLDQTDGSVETLFHHTIAILHAPAYRRENEGALRDDWPRVPLPKDGDLLRESADLGRKVADLLDVEQKVDGVDDGTIRDELRPLGRPEHVEPDAALDPNTDFAVTAGWGYVIPPSTVMPNNGEIDRRSYTPDEEAALPEQGLERWGGETLDLYLNENARWANVPDRVWNYTLGGYPVIKKWLSYREKDVLGRNLKPEEVRHVKHMVRRIAALLLLEPRLDANYEAVKAATED
jgi:hypothetical protein